MLPTVSIILPTFNGEKYLQQQIDSILCQTLTNFELLISDDGSSDGTLEIIDRYASLDSRIRKVVSNGNIGHKRRLLELVYMSKGEFISVSDQDDVWDYQKTEKLINNIGSNALILGRSQLIDGDGNSLNTTILEKLDVDPINISPLNMLFEPLVSAHAAIIRRAWMDPAPFMGSHPFDRLLGLEAIFSDGLKYDGTAVVMHRIHASNQMNNGILKKSSNTLSRYRLCKVASFVRRERVYFYQLMEQMSRSVVLPQDTRQVFKDATEACWYVWYHPSTLGIGPARRLKDKLIDLFGGLAVSENDRQQFEMRTHRLTMPQIAPVNLVHAFASYRKETR